ncbi:NB-ARC domain-containing protein [Actinacidiphila alni]|uniref:NB-ARC domain-containing protein n=1 Tax=Actinacidiphila alni TaxID=380248 RepID=UPI0033C99C47
MDPELAIVLVPGSAAVATAMANDMWTGIKSALGKLFTRGAPDVAENALHEVESARAALAAAQARGDSAAVGSAVAELERTVRELLTALVRETPEVADDVREVLREVVDAPSASPEAAGSSAFASVTGQPNGLVPLSAVPRIGLRSAGDYLNNVLLLRRMDEIWAAGRREGGPTFLYLLGMRGVGKSATAQRWLAGHAHELTGPQLQARLGRGADGLLPDMSAVLGRWLRQLDVPREDVPADAEERRDLLARVLEARQAVILLEDVLLLSQVQAVLPDNDDITVIVTTSVSSSALAATYGAEPVQVTPLDFVHSRALLVRTGRIDVDADQYGAQLDTIAREFQGNPLALRLAGGQLALEPAIRIAELAQEMSNPETRLGSLTTDEELSMAALLDSDYRALGGDAARVYRCIGLLPDVVFDVETVRAALPDMSAAALRTAMRQLVTAHLLEWRDGGRCQVAHVLVQDHARGRAQEVEPPEVWHAVLGRIIETYVEFAERNEAALSGRYRYDEAGVYRRYAPTGRVDEAAVIAVLEGRRDALRHAARMARSHGLHGQVFRLSQALHTFYLKTQNHRDWIDTRMWACEAAREMNDTFALARSLFELGFARIDRWSEVEDDPAAARTALEEALDLVRNLERPMSEGERRTESSVLEAMGLMARKDGRPADAMTHYEESERALDGIHHPRGHALLALHRGPACTDQGRHDEAAATLLSARQQFKDLGDIYNEGRALTRLAEDRLAAGLLADAVATLDDAMRTITDTAPAYQRADIKLLRGTIVRRQGDRAGAVADWTAARDLFAEAKSLRAHDAQALITDDEDGAAGSEHVDTE